MKSGSKHEILKINDPYKRLLYAIIQEAFWDFYRYPHDLSRRIPAFNFLVSGGGYWKDSLDIDVRELFVRYCKENYYEGNSHRTEK